MLARLVPCRRGDVCLNGTFSATLFQGSGYAAECRLEGAADGLHCRENDDGDAHCNQSILNSRRTRLIIAEPAEISNHAPPLCAFVISSGDDAAQYLYAT